jgi:hypothetical protein
VRLGIARARVLAIGGLPIGFFGSVVPFVVAAIGGFHRLVVGDIEDVRFGYAVEVGEVDWGCFDGAVVQTEALAFVPVGKRS